MSCDSHMLALNMCLSSLSNNYLLNENVDSLL